jgi:DNA-binding transcriptional ArsR family regulator
MLNHQPSLDLAFRAMADPTRRAILERLSRGPASVGDLAAPLPMSLPAVHQHVKLLQEAGLVTWEKRGRVRWCRLGSTRLAAAEEWIATRRRLWASRLDALGEHLARETEMQQGGKK